MMDYKDWLQSKAEEIALKQYNAEFYDLPEVLQNVVYNEAVKVYKDYAADQRDRARKC